MRHNWSDYDPAAADDFERTRRECPGKRVSAEGNRLVLHAHLELPGARSRAGIEMRRFDDSGKLVKPWDLRPVVP